MYRSRKEGAKVKGFLDKEISRRTLLKGAIGITGVALAGVALTSPLTAEAQVKATKAAMKYQDKPKGEQMCSNCSFFIAGKTSTADGTCQVVEGSIGPQGWCTSYSKKS